MRYLLLLLLSFFGQVPEDKETVDLKVVVTNINTQKGSIELGIFNNSKAFLKKGKEYNFYSQEVSSDTVIFFLKDYKKDDYAISLYHDVNSDNECNLNFFGIPLEPYGFSRNFKPKLSKPTFNECKIDASEDRSVFIALID